jgi:hypothetical protein
MADRATLHLTKLDEFSAFAATRGYVREPAKGDYEVLRLRRGEEPPLLYYRRHGDHASIPVTQKKNPAQGLVQAWLDSKRRAAKGAL